MSLVAWTSPERRRGPRLLNPIPNEIYLDIFDNICDLDGMSTYTEMIDTLRSLATVCRFFCSTCIPLMYKRLRLTGFPEDDNGPVENTRAAWVGLLQKREPRAIALAAHVRELELFHWDARKDALLFCRGFLNRYASVMHRMDRITSVRLISVPISRVLFTAIAELPQLSQVSLQQCTLAADLSLGDIKPRAQWSSLEVRHSHCDDVITSGSPIQGLMTPLASPVLRSLTVDDNHMAAALFQINTPLHIRTLSIGLHGDSLVDFFRFLERMPTVATLRIFSLDVRRSAWLDISVPTLSKAALPELRELACPAIMMPAFMRRGHIRSLACTGVVYTRDVIISEHAFYSMSGVPRSVETIFSGISAMPDITMDLQAWGVPYIAHNWDQLRACCKSTRKLSLYMPSSPVLFDDTPFLGQLQHFAHKWPLSSTITTLSIVMADRDPSLFYDLERQRDLITRFCPHFPSTQVIRMSPHVEWRGRRARDELVAEGRSLEDPGWRPALRLRDQAAEALRDWVAEGGQTHIRDVAGCLRGLPGVQE